MKQMLVLLLLLVSLFIPSLTTPSCKLTIIGAGVGGLFSAFRLINSSAYAASDVCIFEKTNRVGGRAQTLRGVFPTKSTVDVGAHKFKIPVHQITQSLVEKVFNLHTKCYSKSADCTDEEEGAAYFLREVYTGDAEKSAGLPYFFKANENWDNGDFQDPFNEILGLYPFIMDNIENLTSPDSSVRYPAMKQTLDQLRTYQVNGLYPHQYCARTLLNHSSEFRQFVVDAYGESISNILLVNIYDVLREAIYYAPTTFGKVITDSQGNEIGYSTISESLAAKLVSMGVNLTYHKELSGIYNTLASSQLTLKFSDGTSVQADNVILNIPQKQLLQLSRDSIIFKNSTVNQLYELFRPVAAGKAYFYYSQAWWLPVVNNELSTTNDLRYFEYLDSNVDDSDLNVATNGNTSGTKAYLNIAYPSSQEFCAYYESVRYDKTNPVVVIHANTTDLIRLRFFNDMKNLLKEAQKQLLKENGIKVADIPDPEIFAMGLWPDGGWHQVPLSPNYFGGEPARLMLHPIQGLPVYFVNEAYSVDQGWSEGSLIASEKVAVMLGAGARPNWLGDQYWYDTVIVNNI